MEELRAMAIEHIEDHFKGLKDPTPFQIGRIVGLLSMGKELEVITLEEYLSYYEKLENL